MSRPAPSSSRLLRPFALALLLPLAGVGCGGGGDGGTPDGGDGGAETYALSRLVELPGCENAGEVVADGDEAWVSCAGEFDGTGRIARVDLTDDTVTVLDIGGAPGALALADGVVYAGDLLDGRVLVAGRDGTVRRGADDPLTLCPSDPGAGVFDFIGGISAASDGFVAVCFAADAAVRVADAGSGLVETGRATVGDGPSAVASWGAGRWVTVESLGGTASSVSSEGGGALAAQPARWTVGEGPNDVVVAGDTALVVNSLSNTLQVLDLLGGETLGEIFTGDGTNPYSVAAVGELAFVSLQQADAVAVVDTSRNAVVQTIPMPAGEDLSGGDLVGTAGPQGVAVAGDRVLVALTNLATVEADPFPMLVPAGSGFLAVLEVAE